MSKLFYAAFFNDCIMAYCAYNTIRYLWSARSLLRKIKEVDPNLYKSRYGGGQLFGSPRNQLFSELIGTEVAAPLLKGLLLTDYLIVRKFLLRGMIFVGLSIGDVLVYRIVVSFVFNR